MAEEEDVRPATITDWRKGRLKPDLENLGWLPVRLGVDALWLIGGHGTPFAPAPGESDQIIRAIRRLVDPAHRGSDEAFRELAAWMENEALPPEGGATGQGGH